MILLPRFNSAKVVNDVVQLISVVFIVFAICSCQNTEVIDPIFMEAEPINMQNFIPPATRPLADNDFIAIRNGDYKIQHGDRFEIMVEGQPDTLIMGLPLTPQGYIHYLLCRPFKATGMTLSELKSKLELELDGFFLKPQVFVNLLVNSSNKFQILGQVNTPGSYSLELPVKLRDAIYTAGGTTKGAYRGEITELADLTKSYIIRDSMKLDVDFEKMMHENEPTMNPYLRPGDYVYIAAKEFREVYILGAVTPRAFYHTNDLTMLQVLSSISYSPRATQSKAIILRKRITDNPETVEVDLEEIISGETRDIYLQPDDIIYIPEKPYLFLRNMLRTAVRAYVNTFTSDAARYITTEEIFNNE